MTYPTRTAIQTLAYCQGAEARARVLEVAEAPMRRQTRRPCSVPRTTRKFGNVWAAWCAGVGTAVTVIVTAKATARLRAAPSARGHWHQICSAVPRPNQSRCSHAASSGAPSAQRSAFRARKTSNSTSRASRTRRRTRSSRRSIGRPSRYVVMHACCAMPCGQCVPRWPTLAPLVGISRVRCLRHASSCFVLMSAHLACAPD